MSQNSFMDKKNIKKFYKILSHCKKAVQAIHPFSEVYVFGSTVRGQRNSESDIDIAIVSSSLGKDYLGERERLEEHVGQIDDRFELHLFSDDDFSNPYDGLVTSIKREGILI